MKIDLPVIRPYIIAEFFKIVKAGQSTVEFPTSGSIIPPVDYYILLDGDTGYVLQNEVGGGRFIIT